MKTSNSAKALYLAAGVSVISLNFLLYPRLARVARKLGLRGFWPINFAATAPMMLINSTVLGAVFGVDMAYKFQAQNERKRAIR